MKNVQEVPLSWYFADLLLKIYYADFLITSCHSSVTAPLYALELKLIQADLKVLVFEAVSTESAQPGGALVWIGPLTLLVLLPYASFMN